MPRRTPRLRRVSAVCAALGLFVASCSSGTEVAEPVTTTETPRQVAPEETTTTAADPTTTTSTTTSTTTTTAPPAPPLIIETLGSIRSLPDAASATAEDTGEQRTSEQRVGTDAVIITLGCTTSSGCEPADLAAWAAAQVDVVNLATSAATVDGVDVLDAHFQTLALAGVDSLGYGETLNAALEPTILRSTDRPVAVYSISLDADVDPDVIATSETPGIAAGPDAFDFLVERIADSRAAGQRTMIMVDWGQIDDRAPSEDEIELIEPLIAVGADAVIGHGSDFLQRFERIDQTAVAFNLGNAVTTNDDPLRRDTAVFRFEDEEAGNFTCLLPAAGGALGPVVDSAGAQSCQVS